jgi:hypothetical protein
MKTEQIPESPIQTGEISASAPVANTTFSPVSEDTDGSCEYGGQSYSPGSKVCMGGRVHHCIRGQWIHYNEEC